MANIIKILTLVSVLSLSLLISCNETKQEQPIEQTPKIQVICDESIYDLCKPVVVDYDSNNYRVKIEFLKSTAFGAMAKLLATETDAILLSRDYLAVEDSALKINNVKPHQRAVFAYDALVLYTDLDNNIDTISIENFKRIFTDKSFSFISNGYTREFEIVLPDNFTGEYANLKSLALGNKKIETKMKYFSTSDSALNYVIGNKNSIGVGYLSQVNKKPDLKCIAVSFTDSTGKYIYPRLVHQANIVQGFYPFKVPLYVYILKENSDAQLAFSRYISRVGKAQKHFNNSGIIPAYGDIRLKSEEYSNEKNYDVFSSITTVFFLHSNG